MNVNWTRLAEPVFQPPGPTEVHVCMALLDELHSHAAACYAILDREEKARADAFVFPRDRIRYILSHGVLRNLLAGALECQPEAIRFRVGEYGKPSVIFPDTQGVEFSLSHSGERALIAVARGASLGADIEQHRTVDGLLSLARAQFAPEEYGAVQQTFGARQVAAFFDVWARKEAYIKAIGLGLSADLHSFAVSIGSGQAAQFLRVDDPDGPASEWRLYDIAAESGYSAALAHRGAAREIRLFLWSDPDPQVVELF